MNLFPIGYEDEALEADELAGVVGTVVGYKEGINFDGSDFVRDGHNRIKASTGIESWEQWCIKCLSTERYASPVYPTDYGIETHEVFKTSSRGLAESILCREITEALMADPYGRTAYIEDVTFDWTDGDSLQVSVTAVGIENVTIDITVTIGGENSR